MAFAIEWLAEWSQQSPGQLLDDFPNDAKSALHAYINVLKQDYPFARPGARLLSIFSQIQNKNGVKPPQYCWQPQALSLELPEQVIESGAPDADAAQVWLGFEKDLRQLGLDEARRFDAFAHLLHRWAWCVPCSYGEPGVSLYEEFRTLSALIHASDCADEPADELLLIGGDVPGIQNFVYTITSKGAAKGLRGRSFFIQLLSDALVRRLLTELTLPESNVVYVAGGNFMLLAPARDETEAIVSRVYRQANICLAQAIQGDVALVLEARRVTLADLFSPGSFQKTRSEIAAQIARAKHRPMSALTGDWASLFAPQGQGSELSCAVCQVEVDANNSKTLENTGELAEDVQVSRICHLCASFADLARDIRHKNLWLALERRSEMLDTPVQPQDGWAELLVRMTGWQYTFKSTPSTNATGSLLAINQPDFLQSGAGGFRLLANVTPLVTPEDRKRLEKDKGWEQQDIPQGEHIRSFAILAKAARWDKALERVGVLRMDVDGLGHTFDQGVLDLTLPKLGALSGALQRFFGGYLNTLVHEQAHNDLYIIYAGGDDVFIVGAWHHLPDLAERICTAFAEFTGHNPALGISGGLVLEGAKFPLYRAAERAGKAEHRAKGYVRANGDAKNAFCFLGTVVGWEDWSLVREQKDQLLWLVGARENENDERRLPRALLQTIQNIHQLYHIGLQDARQRVRQGNRNRSADKKQPLPKPQMFFGRWAWMQVYSLTRLAERNKKYLPDAPTRIADLQKRILEPATVRYSGLAARWADYQTRRKEQ